jgi:peptide/nickel transport system ATP-binding protein
MDALLRVEGLHLHYRTRAGTLRAVRDVSFEIEPGEIVGIVGESGCGKSTVASAVLRLLPPNGRISAGQILFKGQDLSRASEERLRRLRGRDISMIFQDPMTSLNPVFTIEAQMVDTLLAHRSGWSRHEALRQQAIAMLERVGIPDAAERIGYYPHQFSGGMRQRIMIAMALMTRPALLIADEPTSALDVTLEAQILDLIRELRAEFSTAILYISHDLGVMAQLCDRLIVMYAGNVVEAGRVADIYAAPKHPYTQALLDAHPSHRPGRTWLTTIPGQVPSLRDLPTGCKFAPRCRLAREVCHTTEPRLLPAGGQQVLCHVYDPRFQHEWADVPLEDLAAPAAAPAALSERAAPHVVGSDRVVAVHDVRVHFPDPVGLLGQLLGQKGGVVRAVDGVDLEIRRGETLGLVGESGSG